MSPFEMTMLICFGASWPFSIYRVWRTRCARGKSLFFLALILTGYLAGIAHKVLYALDGVVTLYGLNALMVGVDLALSARYRLGEVSDAPPPAKDP